MAERQDDGPKQGSASEKKLDIAAVIAAERNAVLEARRRTIPSAAGGAEGGSAGGKPFVGVALSGGGIRSAAFGLGVLQALNAGKAFGSVDYLSTVSGGGYTGAALVAAVRRNGHTFPFATRPETSGDPLAAADIADSVAVRLLRDRSRYLMPNGFLDILVSLGIILRGLAVNVIFVAAALFLAATLTLFLNPTRASLEHSVLYYVLGSPNWLEAWLGTRFVIAKLLGIAFFAYLVFWAVHRSASGLSRRGGVDFSEPQSGYARLGAVGLSALALTVAAELQPPIIHFVATRMDDPHSLLGNPSRIAGFLGSLAAATGILALTWRTLLNAAHAAGAPDASDPEWRFLSRAALVLLALSLPLLIYATYLLLTAVGVRVEHGVPYPLAPAFLKVRPGGKWAIQLILLCALATIGIVTWSARIGPLSETLLAPSWWRSEGRENIRPPATILGIGALGVLAVLVLGGRFAAWILIQMELFRMALVYLVLTSVLSLLAWLFTENANSLHRLYRDRLSEAFNYSKPDSPGRTLRLSELMAPRNSGAANGAAAASDEVAPLPFPIINATVNLKISEKNRRGRNADFFAFTPLHVGSEATGYVPTPIYEKAVPDLDLGTAVAISGAAISPVAARTGSALLGPTLALLNLRLGYWVRNPAFTCSAQAMQEAGRKEWKRSYLFLEAFNLLDEKLPKIYLTDGGHIDNLGLYQLLRRRCDLIIVSDAEADPGMTFSSLVNVELFARIDLGVRIDLPWQAIRDAALTRKAALRRNAIPAAASPRHAHAAIGVIHYPETYSTGDRKALPAKEGIILYVKSSVTGDERDYILDYESRYPRFPHESTGDQFFSEEQFEAYRALGFHAMNGALEETDGTPGWKALNARVRRILDAEMIA